jgi:hypothetical protein
VNAAATTIVCVNRHTRPVPWLPLAPEHRYRFQ